MTINSITINNFQSYFEEETIEFGKGLNLVIGNGGKGKSKLFNAFYWVLFGEIYITSEGWCSTAGLPGSSHNSLHRYEFINKKALSEAKIGDVVPCSVILELIDDRKNLFRIERSVSAKRQDSKGWDEVAAWSVSDENVKVTFETLTGTKTVIDDIAEGKIAELFPKGIRGYIWFQGESLDTLIDFRVTRKHSKRGQANGDMAADLDFRGRRELPSDPGVFDQETRRQEGQKQRDPRRDPTAFR